ncbi:mechanosensitive ion channel family protein [candidate division WOR-3 bacterium]|nr:mechanosensitive ion channel family protein [candidate division WOR-3 bacterium]
MFWHNLWNALREQFLTPEKLAQYLVKLGSIVLIIAALWLVGWIAKRLIKRLLRKGGGLLRERHAQTLLMVSRSLVRYVLFFVGLVMVLRVLGVDYGAILAGAGVAGLAIGFGAQTLVRDFLSGFFLLFEDVIGVGDIVTSGNIAGVVEYIGLRATHIRAFDGTLNVVPNGDLTTIGNWNRGWMRAIVTVDLAYEQDAERGMALAGQVAEQWFNDNQDIALEPPEVQGILSFGESGVTVRVLAKVQPLQHWKTERDLRTRLKKAFDIEGVEIPFARRVVYHRSEEQSAPESPKP